MIYSIPIERDEFPADREANASAAVELYLLRRTYASIQSLGAIPRGVVRVDPLDHFDAIPVGIGNEEPVATGNRSRFPNGDATLAEMLSGLTRVVNTDGKVPGAGCVRVRLLKQVQRLAPSQLEP